jgi:hypothetical protein
LQTAKRGAEAERDGAARCGENNRKAPWHASSIRLDPMGTTAGALRHAGRRYRRAARWVVHPVRGVEREARHLHEIEREGESGETPFIAMLGLVVFLGSVFLVMLGIAFLAYYLS